jgi:hypothetical protein
MQILGLRRGFDADHSSSTYEFFCDSDGNGFDVLHLVGERMVLYFGMQLTTARCTICPGKTHSRD